jgi:hypothetical protein
MELNEYSIFLKQFSRNKTILIGAIAFEIKD